MILHAVIDLVLAGTLGAAVTLAVRRGAVVRREREAIAGLRRALTSSVAQMPNVSIGSAVLSASAAAGIGGDIVDVFALDSRFALLLVADVSGQGIDAAAQTAFIRYTIRTLALDSDGDPAVIVAKFNAMYAHSVKDDEGFVVLIVGIIDSQTGNVRYASAGHEPAFLKRSTGDVTLLAPTGPIVGASPYSAYCGAQITLRPGDVLVWTTDGLTESRDTNRLLLGANGLASWIAGAPSDVSGMARALIAALRARGKGPLNDDVAVLTVAYTGALVPAPRQLEIVRRS